MTTNVFHPATVQLLWLQSRGRRRRIWRRFCQTRRLILSAIACVLAVVWLGNAAMTVWLRESASRETLRALISLGLALYAGWHVTKAAFFRPESPFDWSAGERELLAALPLRPRDLVAYQLASVTVTTFLKAALFTLLLLPDLRCVPLGFLGVVLAMMTLEMLRMTIEIATWGMSRATFLTFRAVVVSALATAGFTIGEVILRNGASGRPINIGEGPFRPFLDILIQLNASAFGNAALPFQPLVDLILADNITTTNAGLAVAALATVAAIAIGVIVLYAVTVRRMAIREKRHYRPAGATRRVLSGPPQIELGPLPSAAFLRPLPCIPRWGGSGALAWRQLIGARRHWGGLLTAMIAPAVFAGASCFVIADPFAAFLATTGTVAFYTFLLLPTALRFDFRRDLDRLTTLKSLPVTPAAVVIGQTLTPVLIATLFQCVVLTFAIIARSLPPHLLLMAMLVLTPLNVLVFGLENLIYLLYPYRVHQEGLEIFVRTMLTFTGKGLLFTVGLVVMSVWGFAASDVARAISPWTVVAINASALFTAGMIVGLFLLAAFVLYGLCRTYRNLDVVDDIPR